MKQAKVPDLNRPYGEKEQESDVEIVVPSKRSGCMIRSHNEETPAPINVRKFRTYIPPKQMLMGCRACYLYVMVPENHQKCPKYRQDTNLFDVSAELVHANKLIDIIKLNFTDNLIPQSYTNSRCFP